MNTPLPNQSDLFEFLEAEPEPESASDKCHACGASMKAYWHKMTPMLADALIKFERYLSDYGVSHANPGKGVALSRDQRANWTKLRFHGLVAKYQENGQHVEGAWLLTTKGRNFLTGVPIPLKVQTFRNRVQEHSDETVTIDLVGGEYLERKPEFEVVR